MQHCPARSWRLSKGAIPVMERKQRCVHAEAAPEMHRDPIGQAGTGPPGSPDVAVNAGILADVDTYSDAALRTLAVA